MAVEALVEAKTLYRFWQKARTKQRQQGFIDALPGRVEYQDRKPYPSVSVTIDQAQDTSLLMEVAVSTSPNLQDLPLLTACLKLDEVGNVIGLTEIGLIVSFRDPAGSQFYIRYSPDDKEPNVAHRSNVSTFVPYALSSQKAQLSFLEFDLDKAQIGLLELEQQGFPESIELAPILTKYITGFDKNNMLVSARQMADQPLGQ